MKIFVLLLISLSFRAEAQQYVTPNLSATNVFTGINQFRLGVGLGPTTVSQLSGINATLTQVIIVSDGIVGSSPCTGGGTGALAVYTNAAWNCLGGSGAGTIGQFGWYLSTGNIVTGNSRLTDSGTAGIYSGSGGFFSLSFGSTNSTAPFIAQSPVPGAACSPISGKNLFTFSTDGNGYLSNNGGSCSLILTAANYQGVIGGTATGTGNAQTITTTTNVPAYALGQMFAFLSAGTNTSGNISITIDGLGTKYLGPSGVSTLWPGSTLTTGTLVVIQYDGTNLQLIYPQTNLPIQGVASLTTTSAGSDNVAVPGMTAVGHCQFSPTNASAAANYSTSYVSAKTTNQITITHTSTSGMTYDVLCTPN